MRVVIAEDLALLRDGLTRLLRDNGFDVVAAVQDGDGLLRAIATEKPDIAIVDIRLPPTFRDEGLRAAIEARARVPETAILVVAVRRADVRHRAPRRRSRRRRLLAQGPDHGRGRVRRRRPPRRRRRNGARPGGRLPASRAAATARSSS